MNESSCSACGTPLTRETIGTTWDCPVCTALQSTLGEMAVVHMRPPSDHLAAAADLLEAADSLRAIPEGERKKLRNVAAWLRAVSSL